MFLASAAAVCGQGLAEEKPRESPPPIQDNSFLMEEAYNQEEGVVQHINGFQRMRGGEWLATFTQEWPVPKQTHQLSYTIPYQRIAGDSAARSGLGDIGLNYRYQLAGSGETTVEWQAQQVALTMNAPAAGKRSSHAGFE